MSVDVAPRRVARKCLHRDPRVLPRPARVDDRAGAEILDLNRVGELEGVAIEDGELVLGSRASWTAIEEICEEVVPEFYKIVCLFGAPQIRHVGTIVSTSTHST